MASVSWSKDLSCLIRCGASAIGSLLDGATAVTVPGAVVRGGNPASAARASSSGRSPSKEVLLKAKGLPQNRCYHRHRKGGPVTERGRREYAEVMRERYQQATKQQRSALLDEYCRVTRCHRKAAIRRLAAAP